MNNSKNSIRKKRFNTVGSCKPYLHYMMDMSAKMKKVDELIDYGDYFTIHRPRQYGKTTLLELIVDSLNENEEYFPVHLTFEDVDDLNYEKMSLVESFVDKVKNSLIQVYPHLKEKLESIVQKTTSTLELSYSITEIVNLTDKKMVLLIDEVDASSNYVPFIKFLSVLRAKYLQRSFSENTTFHCVILAGVHDVKSLKYKIKDSESVQYNSPWNIAVDFKHPMEFNPQEIFPMLSDYNQAEKVGMTDSELEQISQKLYYYTSGYPFLVSRLCQIIVEDVLPYKDNAVKKWSLDDVEKAFFIIQREVNTNFESLIKNIKNNSDLYQMVFDILINGATIDHNPYIDAIEKGTIYGIFKQNKTVKIHNRIYEQLIYNYLITNTNINKNKLAYFDNHKFLLQDNRLNLELILKRFQVFMKENYSQREESFLENQWRLIFLSFLRPILNGNGFDFKEVQISNERRLDVVITFYNRKYIIELKLWRGESYHKRGLNQLYDYLEKENEDTGFLVIFDHRKESKNELKSEWREEKGKKVFAIWI